MYCLSWQWHKTGSSWSDLEAVGQTKLRAQLGLEFEPYRWRPCGMTLDSSRTFVVLKLRRPSEKKNESYLPNMQKYALTFCCSYTTYTARALTAATPHFSRFPFGRRRRFRRSKAQAALILVLSRSIMIPRRHNEICLIPGRRDPNPHCNSSSKM